MDFDVINTHLDERHTQNRERSVQQVLGWLPPDRPTILLGDLNATCDDPIFSALREHGLEAVEPRTAVGTAHGFTGTASGGRIDHILVSRHWSVRSAEVIETDVRPLPSDHWPLVATLRLVRKAGG